ncbi:hypothetical protein E8E14_012568 [Neopestalotiopsis sp. 37M]|nr:hypothetical protein E8E14_012568 [Neopestalotiopsis sp. 37M]
MGYDKSPSPVDKMIVSPARTAVDFCKETWRRIAKSPRSEERPLHISTPVGLVHLESGAKKAGSEGENAEQKSSKDDITKKKSFNGEESKQKSNNGEAKRYSFVGNEEQNAFKVKPLHRRDGADDHASVTNDNGGNNEKGDKGKHVEQIECGDLGTKMPLSSTLSSLMSEEPGPVATPTKTSMISDRSPVILDKDWRRYQDTPVKSSPSSWLGPYALAHDSEDTTAAQRPRSTSASTTNMSIPEASTKRDFGNGPEEPIWSVRTSQPRPQQAARSSQQEPRSSVSTDYQATPPVQFPREVKKKDAEFLYFREVRQAGDGISLASSSQVSLATPTPAVRTAHYHYQQSLRARPHSVMIPQRHVSDSVLVAGAATTTTAASEGDADDWKTVDDTTDGGDISGLQQQQDGDDDDAATTTGFDSVDGRATTTSEQWSSNSVRGQSSTMGNITMDPRPVYDGDEEEKVQKVQQRTMNALVTTPVKKSQQQQRRKVSFADQVTTIAGPSTTTTAVVAAAIQPGESRIPIRRGAGAAATQTQAQNQQQQQQQMGRSTRTHPRFSGSHEVDLHRRRISTPIGPAVLMDPKSKSK